VAEDHQTKNAEAIVSENAAILIPQNKLNEVFESEFSALMTSNKKQIELSQNIKKLALVNATKDIADEVEKLLNK
jgi:UDP-N-acetylglucosamine--N-acetylmuramyl-(pentapeptide) pyrophosphoryl-undecaprenol N-acetylglucosamine transferase